MKNFLMAAVASMTMAVSPVSASDDAKGPVILINAFVVPDGKEAEAIKFWEEAAGFMKEQPGYISTKLHQAILPDATFKLINVAKWESVDAFTNASIALRESNKIQPVEGVVPAPSLYKIIRSD